MATMDTNTAIRLVVWRPVRWSSRHQLLDAGTGHPADASNFHESIYCWEMQDDPRDVLQDAEMSATLEEELFGPFRLENDPDERSIEFLAEKLEMLDNIIDSAYGAWMPSASAFAATDARNENSGIEPRLNRLLAFRHMLQWVYDTFRTVPKASVTFR